MIDHDRIRTLGDIARYHGETSPEAAAFTFEGRTTTYGEFERYSNQAAQGLAEAGVGHGDRIAYLGKNCDRYFEILMGASKLGAVMTPLNWRLAGPEIAYILSDSGSKALFVGPEFTDLARSILADAPSVTEVVAMEGGVEGWEPYESWRARRPDRDPAVEVDPEDIAVQLYTSGTTGRPKGAMLSHRALLSMRKLLALSDIEWAQWNADDVGLLAMPLGHIAGTGWGLLSLYNGAMSVVAREFNPNDVLDYIEHDKVSKLFLVPSAMQIVVRHPRARSTDFSRLKHMLYGASPIPLDLLRESIEVFGCGFSQQYGMTETCGTVVALAPEDHTPEGSPKMRSAGKALPGVEVVILDEAGNRVPNGAVGEIVTRSAANMSGYWNLPDATAKTLSEDNWLRTGDAGYMDDEGYIYIHDRVKDVIISGGENIYPAEVENAVFGHPDVADVAVIGVPDDKWGEAVKAMVVLREGAKADPAAIIAWARERIAAYKCPKSVEFIDALPRNASGKILRRELREPYWAGRDRQVS